LASFLAASFFINKDVILFSIPLLFTVALFLHHYLIPKQNNFWKFFSIFSVVFSSSSLGFLPLVKGSLLIYVVAILVGSYIFLFYKKSFFLAIILIITPFISFLFFWGLSGQKINYAFDYVSSLIPITFAYSDGMGKEGSLLEEFIYIFIVLAICFQLGKAKKLGIYDRLFLIFSVFAYSFFCFKAGYTRHDGHGYIATFALIFLLLSLFSITDIFEEKPKYVFLIPILFFSVMCLKYGVNDIFLKNLIEEKN